MSGEKHTPGPWKVREMVRHGELLGYFVSAPDVNGFAYEAEILGEDEYRDGLDRWAADAHLTAAAPELLEALKSLHSFVAVMVGHGPDAVIPDSITTPLGVPVKIGAIMRQVDAAIAKAESR